MGLGISFGTPQNALFITMGIDGASYITGSYISPFKHSVASTNLDFHYNDFFNKFTQTMNMNREKKKTLKRGDLTTTLED